MRDLKRHNADIHIYANLCHGDLAIYPYAGQVFHNGREVDLSMTEYQLLLHLMTNAGRVVSTGELLTAVWGFRPDDGTNGRELVWVGISRLREKLGERGRDDDGHIRTAHRKGYVIPGEEVDDD